jgi:alanine racemase
MAKFAAACTGLDRHLGYRPHRHLLNSGGVARFPQYNMDMVRLGIGVYGADETSVLQPKLRTVMQLQACVSQVRTLQPGETVGYSRAGQLPAGARIATLGIGYADGVPRALSRGRHQVLINGQPAPIAGNVCMDMCMADVTGIPDVEAGSMAIIFGTEPSVEVTAERLGTIPYEVFTNVGPRVRRVYLETV